MTKPYTPEEIQQIEDFIYGRVETLPDGRDVKSLIYKKRPELFRSLRSLQDAGPALNHALTLPLLRKASEQGFERDHGAIDWIEKERKRVLCIGSPGQSPLHAECRRAAWGALDAQT